MEGVVRPKIIAHPVIEGVDGFGRIDSDQQRSHVFVTKKSEEIVL